MKFHGSLLVIVCCLVVEYFNINQKEYVVFTSADLIYMYTVGFLALLGLLFLLYPLVGHLTRYRSLKWSFGFLIFAASMGTIYVGFLIPISIIEKSKLFQPSHAYLYVVPIILFLVYIIRLGLFQANAIQFGLDQLLDTKTDCFYPLVLLGSECWQFSILLCYY